jgi:hypothetical protein
MSTVSPLVPLRALVVSGDFSPPGGIAQMVRQLAAEHPLHQALSKRQVMALSKKVAHTLISHDNPLDALFERRAPEVHQQPNTNLARLHISHQLRAMNWFDGFGGFQLNDYAIANDQVHTMDAHRLAPIFDSKSPFTLERDSSGAHLDTHCISIRRLHIARSEVAMHDEAAVDRF